MKTFLIKVLCIQMLLLAALLSAQQTPGQATDNGAAPDNSKVNQRDRSQNEATADQQKANRSDRELTRAVRRALVKDKSLSTYAHNVKIISQNGMVTLKGPVSSRDEKQAVEAKAAEVVGAPDKIHSELEVAEGGAGKKPSPGRSANR